MNKINAISKQIPDNFREDDKPYAIVMVGGPASGKTAGQKETIKSLLGISDIRGS